MELGPGEHLHHIVEQSASNISRFGADAIHNTANAVPLEASMHVGKGSISAYYSSKDAFFTEGLTVRQWLSTRSFDEQYLFGMNVLKEFGVLP